MIDTTNWLNNKTLFTNSTQGLNNYVNNITNGYTLSESNQQQAAGSHHEWNMGIKTINHSGVTSGNGRNVRPQQRFTRGLTGGGHVHFIPNVESIRLYGNSVYEGGEFTDVPTGVIGIGIETYRLSSANDTTNFPNGNDAEMEIDVWIFDKSNPTAYAKLENYPVNTTGLGTNWSPHNISQVLWRGALGNSKFDRTFLFHNTQSNAWSWFGGLTLGNLFNDSGRIVVAYRIHDVVSPYSITNEVPHINSGEDVLAQQGIYNAVEPGVNHVITINGSLRASGGAVNVDVVDTDQTNHIRSIAGRIRTTGHLVISRLRNWRLNPRGSVNVSGAIELSRNRAPGRINGQIIAERSSLTYIHGPNHGINIRGALGVEGRRLEVVTTPGGSPFDVLQPERSRSAFVPVLTRFWKRLGLPF